MLINEENICLNEVIDNNSLKKFYHLKFLWQSPHWAEFPDAGGFPVLSDLLHCLQSAVPQFLQGKELDEPHPGEYLHISYKSCKLIIIFL